MPESRPEALVTGAAGFIGRRLVQVLRERGHRVTGLDRAAGADVVADVRDPASVEPLVPRHGIVFHLASVVGVANVLRRPDDTWSTCVEGTEVVCRAALDQGARVVLTSSSEVYGPDARAARREDDVLPRSYGDWPRASYPAGKRVAEEIVLDLCRRGGDGRIARLFNVSGPGQPATGGMVLPTFVQAALAGRALPVVGDGSDVRCFQHVDDAVAGLVRLSRVDRASGLVVNLGAGEAISMRGLAERVLAVLGAHGTLRHVTDAQRYGASTIRCRHRAPSLERAAATLGHRPARALDDVIRAVAGGLGQELRPCAASPATLAS